MRNGSAAIGSLQTGLLSFQGNHMVRTLTLRLYSFNPSRYTIDQPLHTFI
jgi:hypothetical protein